MSKEDFKKLLKPKPSSETSQEPKDPEDQNLKDQDSKDQNRKEQNTKKTGQKGGFKIVDF